MDRCSRCGKACKPDDQICASCWDRAFDDGARLCPNDGLPNHHHHWSEVCCYVKWAEREQ